MPPPRATSVFRGRSRVAHVVRRVLEMRLALAGVLVWALSACSPVPGPAAPMPFYRLVDLGSQPARRDDGGPPGALTTTDGRASWAPGTTGVRTPRKGVSAYDVAAARSEAPIDCWGPRVCRRAGAEVIRPGEGIEPQPATARPERAPRILVAAAPFWGSVSLTAVPRRGPPRSLHGEAHARTWRQRVAGSASRPNEVPENRKESM